MTFFILDIMLTLSCHCHTFLDMYHGHCQLQIEFPPKLTSLNFRMACNYTLNQHYIGHVVLAIALMVIKLQSIILQSIITFPVTFKDLMEPVFNQALKAGHVGFVTDTYIQCILYIAFI